MSRIGRPVTHPYVMDIRIQRPEDAPVAAIANEIEEPARSRLGQLDSLWHDVIQGKVRLY